jgi:uncharacterized membrane protein HdeD (DUF308 family)
MIEALTRNWWAVALRGLAAVLFGLMAIIWPDITVGVLVALFGAFALVGGAFTIIAAFQGDTSDRWWYVADGMLSILIGVIAWVWPGLTALSLLAFVAVWAIVTGVLEMVAAFRLRKVLANEWLLGLGGLASVVFGAIIVIAPGDGAIALIWLIGSYAILFGVLLIALGFRLRAIGRQIEGSAPGGRTFSGGETMRA